MMTRLILALLLWVMGTAKLVALVSGDTLDALTPVWALWSFAILEIITGFLLPTRGYRWGAWLAVALSSLFLVALAVMLALGVDTSACGCFGAAKVSAVGHSIVATSIFFLSAAIIVARPSRSVSPDARQGQIQ